MQAEGVHYQPMTTIKLSGSLAAKFGRVHSRSLDSGQTWEAFKALKATIAGFQEEVQRLDRLGVRFAIFRNRKNSAQDEFSLSGTREIRIVPVVEGSKRGGAFQTVMGTVLIAAALIGNYFVPGNPISPYLLNIGVALVAGGVIQMLSPQASGLKQSSSPENAPSYAFGSAKNTTASGNPVPICIGERRWGGMIISASINAEDKT
ncbi:tail assembly protein [Pseudomonas laurylsulfatiphila]|uniref:tail assembly protein n=1 Tax=Pseudomonas laurylsulfatiphila TaxID=2011015 RepID=UPI00215E43EC|nr:tail assembly protein [Pseudomonas laurylsulfatiphila]UVM07066.1 tail assembly protein [Pseudomonas laurylsulfatiphila]